MNTPTSPQQTPPKKLPIRAHIRVFQRAEEMSARKSTVKNIYNYLVHHIVTKLLQADASAGQVADIINGKGMKWPEKITLEIADTDMVNRPKAQDNDPDPAASKLKSATSRVSKLLAQKHMFSARNRRTLEAWCAEEACPAFEKLSMDQRREIGSGKKVHRNALPKKQATDK